VALTAFATAVHIPWYAVVLGCAGFGLWAYRRTRAATLTFDLTLSKRVIDHGVRRKAPKRSHCDEYQSYHGDLVP
jgi:hypothetical protein